MKNIIASLAILASASAMADEWLESVEAPLSGDRVVLNDKTYVLMTEEDFAALQEKFTFLATLAKKRWNAQHATENGRRDWHGRQIHTTVTTNETGRTVKIVEYEDGYKHTETGKVQHPTPSKPKKEIPPQTVQKSVIRQLKARRTTDVNITKEVK